MVLLLPLLHGTTRQVLGCLPLNKRPHFLCVSKIPWEQIWLGMFPWWMIYRSQKRPHELHNERRIYACWTTWGEDDEQWLLHLAYLQKILECQLIHVNTDMIERFTPTSHIEGRQNAPTKTHWFEIGGARWCLKTNVFLNAIGTPLWDYWDFWSVNRFM